MYTEIPRADHRLLPPASMVLLRPGTRPAFLRGETEPFQSVFFGICWWSFSVACRLLLDGISLSTSENCYLNSRHVEMRAPFLPPYTFQHYHCQRKATKFPTTTSPRSLCAKKDMSPTPNAFAEESPVCLHCLSDARNGLCWLRATTSANQDPFGGRGLCVCATCPSTCSVL